MGSRLVLVHAVLLAAVMVLPELLVPGYYNDSGNKVVKLKHIRRKYLRGWFIPDLISTFPIAVFFWAHGPYGSTGRALQLSQLLRVLQLPKYLKKTEPTLGLR